MRFRSSRAHWDSKEGGALSEVKEMVNSAEPAEHDNAANGKCRNLGGSSVEDKSADPNNSAKRSDTPSETPSGATSSATSGQRGKAKNKNPDDIIIIKKYANRRLYNTGTSSYVTLDYLSEMVKRGEEFAVKDAKTGDDITRSVLTQIIFEEENKGQNLLPIQFLRQLIQFYGDNMQSFVPTYLEMSMNAFANNQEKIRAQMRETFGATPGYNMFEETARQNMALFERTMQMFTPMAGGGVSMGDGAKDGSPEHMAGDADKTDEIEALRAEIANLKKAMANKSNE
ncbi:MAG: polyhydroxyalkanoate synthesis repressor PhaR [Pseudomonadota bacterium]